ncbi:MAG: glycosyltransferase [Nitrospirota bacterium]|nr:glycosyltransferase [Nitrospirota bacterium]
MPYQEKQEKVKAPYYSIIIPAYNEAEWLPQTLQNLRDVMDTINFPGEIIVVDNNSNDPTAEIAKIHGARLTFEAINQISRARNAGARIALSEYLIFLDADTRISEALLRTALKNLEQGHCGGGTTITFDRPTGPYARLVLGAWTAISVYFKLAAGSFIYCRRDAFEQIGGFSEKLYAAEEIRLSSDLKKWGKTHKRSFKMITDAPVITSARKLDKPFRTFLATLTCLFFPFLVYSKTLCWYWYKRD